MKTRRIRYSTAERNQIVKAALDIYITNRQLPPAELFERAMRAALMPRRWQSPRTIERSCRWLIAAVNAAYTRPTGAAKNGYPPQSPVVPPITAIGVPATNGAEPDPDTPGCPGTAPIPTDILVRVDNRLTQLESRLTQLESRLDTITAAGNHISTTVLEFKHLLERIIGDLEAPPISPVGIQPGGEPDTPTATPEIPANPPGVQLEPVTTGDLGTTPAITNNPVISLDLSNSANNDSHFTLDIPIVPATAPKPKIAIAIVGVKNNQAHEIRRRLNDDSVKLRCFEKPEQANVIGYATYDYVIVSRHCTHTASDRAKAALGASRVVILQTSITKIVKTIKSIVSSNRSHL